MMNCSTTQQVIIFVAAWTLLGTGGARANDHNNLDSDRPLSFEDAESIAYGEQSLEFGAYLLAPINEEMGGQLKVEYLYGFAPNSHLVVGIAPQVGNRDNQQNSVFDVGNFSVGAFHNFNREYDDIPAFAIRADVEIPTGRDSQGVDLRVRTIASKTVGQYERLHLNLDLNLKTETTSGDRSFLPALIVGYSQPLGYPRRFDQTLLAEVGVLTSEQTSGGAEILLGVGLRQQVSVQGIFDIGLEGKIATGTGGTDEIRLTFGYSLGF